MNLMLVLHSAKASSSFSFATSAHMSSSCQCSVSSRCSRSFRLTKTVPSHKSYPVALDDRNFPPLHPSAHDRLQKCHRWAQGLTEIKNAKTPSSLILRMAFCPSIYLSSFAFMIFQSLLFPYESATRRQAHRRISWRCKKSRRHQTSCTFLPACRIHQASHRRWISPWCRQPSNQFSAPFKKIGVWNF